MMAWKQMVTASTMMAGLLACNAAWADHVDMRIVRDYPAGSPAIAQIHTWLQQQSRLSTQPKQMPPPASAAELGAVRTSMTSFDNPLGTRTDAAGNAAPLPAHGKPRDVVSVEACHAGTRYRWDYVWQTATPSGWRLQSYRQ